MYKEQKKVGKWGTSVAVRLDKREAERMKIKEGDVITVEYYGSKIVIKKGE